MISRIPKKKILFKLKKIKKGYRFIQSNVDRSCLYTYVAFVTKIIDGDSLWVEIDLGFNCFTQQKLRLRGIDTPEISTAEGIKAKQFVERVLNKSKFIIVKTYWADKYRRYLTDLFYLNGEKDPTRIVEKGHFLNQELIDKGFATIF